MNMTTKESMRDKVWVTYTATFWWPAGGVSPLVIPYATIDGVLRKFKEAGGSSYTLEDNSLRGTHTQDGKGWVLEIQSHYMSTDEGQDEEDR